METITTLLTIDEAVAKRLVEIDERQHQEKIAQQELDAKIEAGRVEFAKALSAHIAHTFDLLLPFEQLLDGVSYDHTEHDHTEHYRFNLELPAEPLENAKVKASISLNYSQSADDMSRTDLMGNRFKWKGVRRVTGKIYGLGEYDGDPQFFTHETTDLIAAITFAKTGRR